MSSQREAVAEQQAHGRRVITCAQSRSSCRASTAQILTSSLALCWRAHRACYGVLRFVMEAGAKGCEVIVSGKLRAQRAKSMKFKDGYMVSSGDAARVYIDSAVRHVLLRQGVLGIKVRAGASHHTCSAGMLVKGRQCCSAVTVLQCRYERRQFCCIWAGTLPRL